MTGPMDHQQARSLSPSAEGYLHKALGMELPRDKWGSRSSLSFPECDIPPAVHELAAHGLLQRMHSGSLAFYIVTGRGFRVAGLLDDAQKAAAS
jgi:hypothetical protein